MIKVYFKTQNIKDKKKPQLTV